MYLSDARRLALCDCAMRRVVHSQFQGDPAVCIVLENILHISPASATNPDRDFMQEEIIATSRLSRRSVARATQCLSRAGILTTRTEDARLRLNVIDAVEDAYARARRDIQARRSVSAHTSTTPWRCLDCESFLSDAQIDASITVGSINCADDGGGGVLVCTLCMSARVVEDDTRRRQVDDEDEADQAYLAVLAARGDAYPDVYMLEEADAKAMRVAADDDDDDDDDWEDVDVSVAAGSDRDAVEHHARA